MVRGNRGESARRSVLAAAMMVLLGFVAAGCGDGGGPPVTLTELGRRLPEDVRDRGRLIVGSDIAYAPMEFYREGTEVAEGVDIEVCQAIAARFGDGFRCDFRNAVFDTLITGLAAGRFDLVMSSMTDTVERQKEVDFVDYFLAGSSIMTRKGNPERITSMNDLCGRTVAFQRGTTNERLVQEQSDRCRAQGGRPITMLAFDTDPEAQQQVKVGRAVADIADFPVAAYAARTSGGGNDFDVVGEQIDPAPYGIAVDKGKPALRDAVQAALRETIADGTYDRILQKWGVTQGAVRTAEINGAR
ncbi:MAG: ABC transporter substrate-binding protein [Actinomycetota bacterium]|nr:ABC transporter substrate-binding protein [Actinomycetota bacterium]